MNALFSKVLEMSLYGSIAIVAVLIFRRAFRKCPRRVILLFWLVVALRLMCPFNFNSPVSVLNLSQLFPSKKEVSETTDAQRQATIVELLRKATGDSEIGSSIVSAPAKTDSTISFPKLALKDVLSYIWLCVTVFMMLIFSVRYIVFNRMVRKGKRREDGSYCLDNIDTPFVIGFFRPRMCLPSNFDEEEKEYILCHEESHIRHHDGLIKLLCYLILCIHWFNPLVWVAFLMVCADLEMRADEEVIRVLGKETKKEYCRSIVDHAVKDPAGTFMQNTAFRGLGFGGMEAKMRVRNLLENTKASRELQWAAILITLTIALLVSAYAIDFGSTVADTPKGGNAASITEEGKEIARKKIEQCIGLFEDDPEAFESVFTRKPIETSTAEESAADDSEVTEPSITTGIKIGGPSQNRDDDQTEWIYNTDPVADDNSANYPDSSIYVEKN